MNKEAEKNWAIIFLSALVLAIVVLLSIKVFIKNNENKENTLIEDNQTECIIEPYQINDSTYHVNCSTDGCLLFENHKNETTIHTNGFSRISIEGNFLICTYRDNYTQRTYSIDCDTLIKNENFSIVNY